MKITLIIGSGPNSIGARAWDRKWFTSIVAINNAWRVRPDWDFHIHPDDFPEKRRPGRIKDAQRVIKSDDYVPLQNALGGFVYAGGTMAFTAGYWALAAQKPDVLAFIGCDMIYPEFGNTHFYGVGEADPLRDDITLQSLEAKSARLAVKAAQMGCACVNLSRTPSRLVFPRAEPAELHSVSAKDFDRDAVAAAQRMEQQLGYFVASGKYWKNTNSFDARKLAELDALWLAGFAALQV